MLLLAAAYLYATATLPSMEIGDPLGPKAFPVLLGILLAIAGVLLLIESRSPREISPAVPGRTEARPHAVAGVTIATGMFFALLEPLGYLIAFTLYLFLVMRWLHGKRPVTCLVISVLFAIGSYALFAKALGVTLPKGFLYF